MTPLPPSALKHLLETLPPERPDPFPHLANLTPDQLLERRIEISGQLKSLEQERQAIDAELLEVFSDLELRFGVRVPGGRVLRSRSRTSWNYAPTSVSQGTKPSAGDQNDQSHPTSEKECLFPLYPNKRIPCPLQRCCSRKYLAFPT